MGKFFNFSSNVQNVFKNDESVYMDFQSMLNEAALNKGMVDGYTKKEVNDKIVSIFRQVIGCDEHSTAKDIRRGIRRNRTAVFDILEEIVENMLVTGWQNDPFIN